MSQNGTHSLRLQEWPAPERNEQTHITISSSRLPQNSHLASILSLWDKLNVSIRKIQVWKFLKISLSHTSKWMNGGVELRIVWFHRQSLYFSVYTTGIEQTLKDISCSILLYSNHILSITNLIVTHIQVKS